MAAPWGECGGKAAAVARVSELERFATFLAGTGPDAARVLSVHGPAGIGKTALLAAYAEVAAATGWTVRRQLGPEVDPAELAGPGRALTLVDEVDLPADAESLRQQRSRLDPAAKLVIASRLSPERLWHATGWQSDVDVLVLDALDPAAADDLLRRRGVTDPADRSRLVEWSGGYPLGLSLAADRIEEGANPAGVPHDPDLAATIVRHLVGPDAGGRGHLLFLAAAIAAELDEGSIGAALPEADSSLGEAWLRDLTCVEPHGARLRLVNSVRGIAARAVVAADAPNAVVIRRNLADHFLRRAVGGDPRALMDECALLQDQRLMPALVQLPELAPRLSVASGEELEEFTTAAAYPAPEREQLRRWLEESPEYVVVVRAPDGSLLSWLLAVSPVSRPAWADEDPVVGPWLRHVRAHHQAGDAFLVRDIADFGPAGDPVAAMVGWSHAWFLRGMGVSRERYCYYAIRDDPAQRRIVDWLEATGHHPVSGLPAGPDRRFWLLDYGEGGLVAHVWRLIHAELGLPVPAVLPGGDLSGVVRDALRSYQDAGALAASPLARGTTTRERADYVRWLIGRGLDTAFGTRPADVELRTALEGTYLGEARTVAQLTRDLGVSRATYYRRLAEAMDRLARAIS